MPKKTSRKYLRKSIKRNRKLSKKKQSYKRKMIKRNLKLGGAKMEQNSLSDNQIEYQSNRIYEAAGVFLNSPHINKLTFDEMVRNAYEIDLIHHNAPPMLDEVFTDNQRIEILIKHLLLHMNNKYLSETEYTEIIKETITNLLDKCLRIWYAQRK